MCCCPNRCNNSKQPDQGILNINVPIKLAYNFTPYVGDINYGTSEANLINIPMTRKYFRFND